MHDISMTQLWNRAWTLFKPNWQLLVGIFFLIVIFNINISFQIGTVRYSTSPLSLFGLFFYIALTKACLLVARQGIPTLKETFQEVGTLIIIFIHKIILYIIPILLIFLSIFILFFSSIMSMESRSFGQGGPFPKLSSSAGLTAALLVMAIGWLAFMMVGLFGWAGRYYILEGKAGSLSAI